MASLMVVLEKNEDSDPPIHCHIACQLHELIKNNMLRWSEAFILLNSRAGFCSSLLN